MSNISVKFILSVTVLLFLLSVCVPKAVIAEVGIKTSYKQYKIYEYKGAKILCEPYVVKKDDWLYKIFRRKGLISTENFSLFIAIFSNINPNVSNVDIIEPGAAILIPLRKIKKGDYIEKQPGIVQVPVINYADVPKMFKPYVAKHQVKKGEFVSTLIDQQFLNTDGSISKQGIQAFKLSNPDIKNINLIYENSSIFLPDPKLLSEPWFKSLFANNSGHSTIRKAKVKNKIETNPLVSEYQSGQLKKYASLIGGTLSSSGDYYFPDQNNNMSKIDLSITPIITLANGQKILLIPEDVYNKNIITALKTRWEDLKVQKISEAIENFEKKKAQADKIPLKEFKSYIKQLLTALNFKYVQDSNIKFQFNSISLNAAVGRIRREKKQDLLIDFGNILGNAFTAIIDQGNDLISLKPETGKIKATHKLLRHLGLAFVQNPSFLMDKKVLTVKGLYISELEPEIFVAQEELSEKTLTFLKTKNIKLIN